MITSAGSPIVLTIDDASMAGEARRAATALAGRLGFDETERGKVAILVTEAATNLWKHATAGEIIIQGLEWGVTSGIEILALDRGPGMEDVARCRSDGFSTAGSPGAGLGAMGRLSSFFDIHSLPGVGTVVLARIWARPGQQDCTPAGLAFGVLNTPLAGEEVCGDSWAIEEPEGRPTVLVVDGLGHGPQAAEAAREAVAVFRETAAMGPAEVIRAAHSALRATRGAAIAVARLDRDREEVRYAGVGNISGLVLNPADEVRRASMVSHNGTAGHTIRKIQEFTYPWLSGSLLVMYSDGLGTQWQVSRYAGLGACHPGLVAGVLYRDFKRARDDTTVVVARQGDGSR